MSSNNDLGTMSVGIALDTAGLVAGLSGARDMLGGFAGVAASALVGVGVAMTTMAGNFEQGVTRLRTGAGDVQDSFAALSSGILKVSTATGEMTGALVPAMYDILSSGQRGAKAFDTLAAAAKGAQVEQANVVDVADTLAGAMTNFGTTVFSATDYMNGLMTAVSRGRITLQDLSTAMGPIEPAAHAMGISFSDLAAAMSTQTNAAIPAERAATGLRFMMQSLEVPTKKAKDAMAEWGLSSVAVADEMKVSLPDALQMIYDAAKRAGPEGSVPFDRAISDMVGGQRSLSAFLALTGGHMKAFKDNADAVAASMKSSAGEVSGWALVQSNFNIKMDEAKAAVEALGIKLGTALLPVAGQLFDTVTPLIQRFSDWADKGDNLQGMLSTIGGVIKSDVIDPALKLYNAVEPIVQDFITWNDKTHFLQNTLQDVGGFINTVAGYIANNLVPPVRSLIGHFEDWLTQSNFVHDALKLLSGVIGDVTGVLGTLVGWVSDFIGGLEQGNPLAVALAVALATIGTAIAGIKITEFALGLQNAFTQAGGLGGSLEKFANYLLPNLSKALGLVGTTAKVDMAGGIAQGSLWSEASLAGVGTEAEVTAGMVKTASLGMVASLGLITAGIGIVIGGFINMQQQLSSGDNKQIAQATQNQAPLIPGGTANTGIMSFVAHMLDATTNLHDQVVAKMASMKDMSAAQVELMRQEIVTILVHLAGKSADVAAQMANDWLTEGGKMVTNATVTSDQVASRVTLILGGLVDESDTWGNGIGSQVAAGIMNQIGAISSASDHAAGEVKAYLQGLTEDAWGWGNDSGSQFAAGLYASAAKISSAADHAAGEVRAFLQFSLPEKGPLAHFDESMPHMGDMLAEGILAQRGKVGAASHALAGTIAQGLPALPMSPLSGSVTPYTNAQTSAMMSGGHAGGPTTIVLEIDGRQFAAATVEHIAPAIVNRLRLRVGMRQ